MTSNRPPRSVDNSLVSPESLLVCATCHTAKHLIIESIQPHKPRLPGIVEVEYSCERCQSYSAHACSVGAINSLLNPNDASDEGTGVIQFGGEYIHCGEPMERTNSLAFMLDPSNNQSLEGPLGDRPPTVLQCHCGFHLELCSSKAERR